MLAAFILANWLVLGSPWGEPGKPHGIAIFTLLAPIYALLAINSGAYGIRMLGHVRTSAAHAISFDGFGGAEAFILPHHAAQPPRAERRDDDAAERRVAAVRDAIVERAEGGGQKEDAGTGHGSDDDIGARRK